MPNRPVVLAAIDHWHFEPRRDGAAERTVRAAIGTAEASGADVHVIRVMPHRPMYAAEDHPWGAGPGGGSTPDEGGFASPQPGAGGTVRIRYVTLRGTPERVIPAYAELTQAAVLVLQRDYGSSRFWRNAGVVEGLARRSPVPLLVLPQRHARDDDQSRPRRIVTPFDFSVASAVALRTAIDLSRRHEARLTLVHALEAAPRDMVFSGSEAWGVTRGLPTHADAVARRLRRAARFFGVEDVDTAVSTGVADAAILENATRSEADVVVMGVTRRSWLDRVMFGSTLRRVLRRSTLPILVVPVTAGAGPWPVPAEAMRARSAAAAADPIAA